MSTQTIIQNESVTAKKVKFEPSQTLAGTQRAFKENSSHNGNDSGVLSDMDQVDQVMVSQCHRELRGEWCRKVDLDQPKNLREGFPARDVTSGAVEFHSSAEQQDRVQVAGGAPQASIHLDSKTHTIAHAAPTVCENREFIQDFLHTLRCEEGIENEERKIANRKRCMTMKFYKLIETVEKELNTAENGLEVLYNAKTISILSGPLEQMGSIERHVEENLARANAQVASLVADNYADGFDFQAATEPIIALIKSIRSIVDDGSMISSTLHEDSRKSFIEDLRGLCEAMKDICKAARSNNRKLNDAALAFGDRSTKLLGVVSSDVNTTLENEIISRAKSVRSTVSQLTEKARNIAHSISDNEGSHKQDICTASESSVDAAEKLVYTAKLVAPTIRHSTCQDALASSGDSLTSSLSTFSNIWKTLTSAQSPNVQKIIEEAGNIGDLVEKLMKDVKTGKLEKRLEEDRMVLEDQLEQEICIKPAAWKGSTTSAPIHAEALRDLNSSQNGTRPLAHEKYVAPQGVTAAFSTNTEEAPCVTAYSTVDENVEAKPEEGNGETHVGLIAEEVHDTFRPPTMCREASVIVSEVIEPEELKIDHFSVEKTIQDVVETETGGPVEETHLGLIAKEVYDTFRPRPMCCEASVIVSEVIEPEELKSHYFSVEKSIQDVEETETGGPVEETHLGLIAKEVYDTFRPRPMCCEASVTISEVIEPLMSINIDTENSINDVEKTEAEGTVKSTRLELIVGEVNNTLRPPYALAGEPRIAGQTCSSGPKQLHERTDAVKIQFNYASKWLSKFSSKPEVKADGQQAVRNLIQVATEIAENLKGHDKEDMRLLIIESEQLLTECTKLHDHKQYSVLMERVRELKKGIERGVLIKVVEDFMEAEAPLADLDTLVDHGTDAGQYVNTLLLKKKIEELLAHCSRFTNTARLVAMVHTNHNDNINTQLIAQSEKAKVLASMLEAAAEKRARSSNYKVIANYKSLVASYSESLSKIRDLCDLSVDPMDFVQTASETIRRMREECLKHNDPTKCAYASTAITRLGHRVIQVSLSSSTVRGDPKLQKALLKAQQQLSAAASADIFRKGDWQHTTAEVLRITEEADLMLSGEMIFMKKPEKHHPIYNEALNLHAAVRDWSSRDNEIVAVAKRMAVLMAKLSNYMHHGKQHEVLMTLKSIVKESQEVVRHAKKLAHECPDRRIETNLLQACESIPTISGQLRMLISIKASSFGQYGVREDRDAMDTLVLNAQSLMLNVQYIVKGAAGASVKIKSQRGLRMMWVRKTLC